MKVVAFERSVQGTGASRRLRNSGKTPGIIYGGKQESPCAIELDHNALFHALRKEAFHSSILDIELNGKAQKLPKLCLFVCLSAHQSLSFSPLLSLSRALAYLLFDLRPLRSLRNFSSRSRSHEKYLLLVSVSSRFKKSWSRSWLIFSSK